MMKNDLPSPLRVGVWGAISYIVGKVVYSLVLALFGLLTIGCAFAAIGLMVYACQLWPTWELCTG